MRCIRTVVVLLGVAATAHAETLTYTLRPEPDTGRLIVTLAWQTADRTTSLLCTAPRWGSVADVPALLGGMQTRGGVINREGTACWTIQHPRRAVVEIRYAVDPHAGSISAQAPHQPTTTRHFFHGIGSTFLLTPQPASGMPGSYEVVLRWELPPGWQAVCSWGLGRTTGDVLTIDVLRDSVYLAGNLEQATATLAGGSEMRVAIAGKFAFSAADVARCAVQVAEVQARLMQDTAFPPQLVTVVPVLDQRAGVGAITGNGLYNSVTLMLPEGIALTEGVEHVFAHELFHHWNGRTLRPADPPELVAWFTEGLTDYYALRSLYMSGRWHAATYARWLNRHLAAYAANPAKNAPNAALRGRMAAEPATYGELPYQRGLALGLRWHRLAEAHAAQARGAGGKSDAFDALLVKLLAQARRGADRVTNLSIRSAGTATLGQWFGPEFDRYVNNAETVDVPLDALAPALIGEKPPEANGAVQFRAAAE